MNNTSIGQYFWVALAIICVVTVKILHCACALRMFWQVLQKKPKGFETHKTSAAYLSSIFESDRERKRDVTS